MNIVKMVLGAILLTSISALADERQVALDQLYIAAGMNTSNLSQEAKSIERDLAFKQIFLAEVGENVGEISRWNTDIVKSYGALSDGQNLLQATRGISDDEAQAFLQSFIDRGPGADKVKIVGMRSSCRATPTGWVRDRHYQIELVSDATGGQPWKLDTVLDRYQRETATPVPAAAEDEISKIYIELVVVNSFDL